MKKSGQHKTKGVIRILLVDDSEIIRNSLASLLEFEDDLLVVAQADSGQSAIEMVRVHKPDVVLMDISMPNGLDGIQSTTKILAEFPNTKIIGLSLFDDDEMIFGMLKAGSVTFVCKTNVCEILVDTIRGCYCDNSIKAGSLKEKQSQFLNQFAPNQTDQGENPHSGKTKQPPIDPPKLSDRDIAKTIADLELHQIELQMQNEELQKNLKELEESRSRYADLFDFAPIGYFVFDKNGIILNINLTGCSILAAERFKLIAKPFWLNLHPGDRDKFFSHTKKVFQTEDTQSCQLRLVNKKGSEIYINMQSKPVREAGIAQCWSAVTDITIAKLAAEDLTAKKELLRNIANTAKPAAPLNSKPLDNNSQDS